MRHFHYFKRPFRAVLILLLLSLPFLSRSQNVGINQSGAAPDPSAMLDVVASDMGVLIPRVQLDDASTQAPIASAPVEGLLIYNETGAEPTGFYYWDGAQWVRIDDGGTGFNTNLVLNGNTLELTDGGGTLSEDLSPLIDDADADPTNEYNTNLTLNGSILELTDGGGTLTQDLSSLGGGGGFWDRDASNGFLYPSNVGDSVHVGHNGNGGKVDVRQAVDVNTSAVYGLAEQATDSWDYHRVGVRGEANGLNGFGISYGVLGMTDPSQGFISNAVVARLGSTPPSGWGSWSGNSALFADANGMGKAGHFTGGAVTVQFNTPQALFHVANGTEADLETNNSTQTGFIMAGRNSATNIRLDDDEILAQDGGGVSTLHLQQPGGAVHVHSESPESEQVMILDNGNVGIGTNTPQENLHILDENFNTHLMMENGNNNTWGLYMASTDNLWFEYNGTMESYIATDGTYNVSDRRLKEGVEPLGSVLDRVQKLTPSRYFYKRDEVKDERTIGFIAQEVKPIFSELVDYEEEAEYFGLNYDAFSAITIKAIQEQQKIIEEQKEELREQKERNDDLEERLQDLEERLEKLEGRR